MQDFHFLGYLQQIFHQEGLWCCNFQSSLRNLSVISTGAVAGGSWLLFLFNLDNSRTASVNGHSSTPNISWCYAGWGSAPTSVLQFFSVFKHRKGGKVQDLLHAIEHCKAICGCWGIFPSTAGLWLKPLISSITSQNSGTGAYVGKVAALCSQLHGSTLTLTESGLSCHGCKKVIRPFTAMWLIWKMPRIILINDRWCQRGRNCI